MKSSNPIVTFISSYNTPILMQDGISSITFIAFQYMFPTMNMCSAWRWLLNPKYVADDDV